MKNVVIGLLCFALSACAISHKTHLSSTGNEVNPEQVALIQPGTTDKQWVLRNLGTPDRLHADKDGMEIFEYVTEEHESSRTSVILLFSWNKEKVVQKTTTRVVMRDGIVESVDTTQT
jgi:outer membrane protein assembly factor BamE (lipoprotein component of BamABCDE complex)